jgi:hypothetical protein
VREHPRGRTKEAPLASTESIAIVQTVACELGRCGSCRGVVFSITNAHLTDCQHDCHSETKGGSS